MFERLKTKIETLRQLCREMGCHRAVHGGLALTHGAACADIDKLAVYGPAALLYAVLAWRG